MSRVAIAGGGIIGLTLARELHRRGHTVTLLERAGIGAQASWAGAGVLSPLPPWRYPLPVQTLAAYSQALYPELTAALRADTGIDPEYRRCGLLVLDEHDSAAVAGWAARTGAPFERLDAAALARAEPALTGTDRAIRLPAVAQVRNPRLVRALHADLLRRGVDVRAHCAVTGAHPAGTALRVNTGHGALETDHLVLAAGAWSAGLLPGPWQPDVAPVRGQMLLFDAAPDLLRHVVLTAQGHYLVPRADGRILAGSTVEHVGFDASPTAAAHTALAAMTGALVPTLRDAPPAAHWAGLRPATPSGVPLIGPHPQLRGVWLATGHYRNGLTLAPGTATLLADLMEGRTPPVDATAFAPAPAHPPGAL